MAIKFSCEIKSNNAAFTDAPGDELARILRALADRIESGAEGHFVLRDVNGNKVGEAFVDIWPDEGEEE